MELVVLTREQYRADLEEAAERGARIALASVSGSDSVVADCHGSRRAPAAKAVLTTREVADEYGVETDTVLRWVRDGLRAVKRGRQYLYRRDDVEAFLVPPVSVVDASPSEPLVGIDVAAELLGVRPSTVRDYYRKKGLPMHKPGREAMFYPSEVRAWATAR